MLDQDTIVPYLLRHGLADQQSIAEGDLSIYETSHRNSDFKVVSERATSCMLKQGVDEATAASIAHEAEIYSFLHSFAGCQLLSRYLPRCYFHDPEEHIIVIELVQKAENLELHHRRLGRFSVSIARDLGHALGTLHRMSASNPPSISQLPESPYLPPAILTVHRPHLPFYHSISNANIQLVGIIQRFPQLGRVFDELRNDWKTEVLIHGDIKWSNLVVSRPGKTRKPQLKIVDWEFAGRGDPCWDAGSVFNDYLGLWLLSIPITGKDPPDRFLDLARYPLARMQPAIRAFWQSYVSAMRLDATAAARWLERAVRLCGVRLIQTAFERAQDASDLNGNLVSFVQLSLNIISRPQQAATRLLGIPWEQVQVF